MIARSLDPHNREVGSNVYTIVRAIVRIVRGVALSCLAYSLCVGRCLRRLAP